MKKKILPILLLVLSLVLPFGVSATESIQQTSRTEAFYDIPAIPACWNPAMDVSADAEVVLKLTADRLYQLSPDGMTLTPSMAADFPQDVTSAYAGSYDIPQSAVRGYAFLIHISPEARWENGNAVTSADFLQALHARIENRTLGIGLAGLNAWYEGWEKGGEDVISLKDAGFSSRKAAEEAGYTAFYVDTTRFWGLDAGWVSVQDRTRLKDSAIPSGVTEMYVSGAYLYSRYLADGGELSRYQDRFLGISAKRSYVSLEDIGILTPDESSFVLILEQPTTAEALALMLEDLIPVPESKYADNYATSPATYTACGPYRIASVSEGVMELVPNPHYSGNAVLIDADLIRIREIGA